MKQGDRIERLNVIVGSDDPGKAWDAFVMESSTGHLMQSRAWASVRSDTGWTPIFLRLEEETGIRAAALLLRRRLPGTKVSLLYMPRGPVLDWSQSEQVEQFAGALLQVAYDQGAFLVQADPAIPEERGDVHTALSRMGFQRVEKQGLFRILQPGHVMRIPVDRYGGPEGLLAALPKNTRYSINLAKRKGVVIVPRTDWDALQIFHRLLSELGRQKGFPVRGIRFHEAIWRHCIQAGFGEYLFAEYGGQVLAVIQVLRFGPTAWYMYGASTREHQDLMASYLLQWVGITRSWAAGCRCYDMRGAPSAHPRPEDPEYGVYDFKRRFKAELVSFLGEYDLVISPTIYAGWRWLEQAAQRPAAWSYRFYQKLGRLM